MNKFIDVLKDRLPNMILFGILFATVGQLLTFAPEFYYKYLDKEQYYELSIPMKIELDEYCPCSNIRAFAKRKSLVDAQASVIRELILVGESGDTEEVYYDSRNISINKGDETVSFFFQLPCDINDGTYYYRGTISFDVLGNVKTYYFFTDTFEVIKK